ncbi:MAG: phenylalanine--tRNA ligase subunit beta [Omnitrophica WOR_2 bacterium RIFCSPLOWO2_01_FULL_41_12]|nr:MAG: phenylalanine--tRNA ligase subunit beta [Omnitrophica WOR_2 bacterium RIFCSPLOWO2_01_FULL_41_12]
MKVTYNWLKDFVEIKISPQALGDKLTMAGLEVTALEEKGADFVLEIEITPNRPDLLSVIGIAREVAAITKSKIKNQKPNTKHQKPNSKHLQLKIEDKKDCPLYTAKIIKDVKVGPSPDWLRTRLELIGCRSVNNIVDITNYVLFSYGEPLHAFDLDKLGNTIVVRRVKNQEKIITLDQEERVLDADILVIADDRKPIAIAGIMGGKDTEVNYNTKNILLEAAIFNPVSIRRARQKLGLQTDSSYRFERGVDLGSVKSASLEAAKLIQDLTAGQLVNALEAGLPKTKQKAINLDTASVNKILGIKIPVTRAKRILVNLGFKVFQKKKNNFLVKVPLYREDINLAVDLVEEIARIWGYENIPKSLPKVSPDITASGTRGLVALIKNILAGLGLNEVITYSLMDRSLFRDQQTPAIEILNPLSKEQEALRPTLIPGLGRCIAYNLNQKQNQIHIFEIAKSFRNIPSGPLEVLTLGIAICGIQSAPASILHLKGILEVVWERLGIKDYSFQTLSAPFAVAVYLQKEKIGFIAQLQRASLEMLEIKNKDVFSAEIDLDKLFSSLSPQKKFTPLPLYPGISRDISLVVKEGVLVNEIREAMLEKARPLLCAVKIIDYYQGKQIPPGHIGLTLACLYRSSERTLTEEEINSIHAQVLDVLVKNFAVQIR